MDRIVDRGWIRTATILTMAGLFVGQAAIAWGRAGGGESYGGGGGGGGGRGGGSGGGGGEDFGWLVYLLIRLVFEHPLIGIPTVIVVIIFLTYAGNSTHSGYVTHTIRRGQALQALSERVRALALLKSRDPQFREQNFIARVSQAFLKIQEAWSRQSLGAVRPFISDGIRERFSLQFKMQQALGYRNQLDAVQVRQARIAAIASDARFDTIHVEFRAAADDYRVDLKSGRNVAAEAAAQEFVEYWSFHRRPGAQTLAQPGSLEGHCPHCGAPLQITDVAQCSSCRSVVNSGEHDWVLTEITQVQEWGVPEEESRVAGLADLIVADPAFSMQHVEDRVSVMFWRLRAAEFFADPVIAAPVTTPRYLAEFTKAIAGPTRRYSEDAAVGKVECVGFRRDVDFDRLSVAVRWSGTLIEGDPLGAHREVRARTIRTHVYELIRKPGVASQPDAAFASASCPQCGAPIAISSEALCAFCGANLTDGSHDWVLDAVGPWTPPAVVRKAVDFQQMPAATAVRSPVPPTRAAMSELSLAVLARVVAADGQIDPRERQALAHLGARRNLSQDQVEAVLNTAATNEIELPVPRDALEAADYLKQIVGMTLADGTVSAPEQKLLMRCARQMNLSPADVRLEIARQRRLRFHAAKEAIRESKRGSA